MKNSNSISSRRVRPEQKPRLLLKKIIARFTQPRALVADVFAGTFSTALVCMNMDVPSQFVGCENDHTCFGHAKHNAIVHYARKMMEMNYEQRITAQLPNMASQSALVASRKVPAAKKRFGPVWKAPKWYQQYKTFAFYITAFLAGYLGDPTFVTELSHKMLHQWSKTKRGLLSTLDVNSLLAVEASTLWLYTSNSKRRHP